MEFLAGKSEQTVKLERILGIGGEGVVLSEKMTTKEHHYRNGWDVKKEREVAVKFVKFDRYENEDLEGPDEYDVKGRDGGIDKNGKKITSEYFKRLRELGDFKAAKNMFGGYSRPYIDFAISKIHSNYFFVIGEFRFKYSYKNKNSFSS